MKVDLSCYGEKVAELADRVGDFDLRSPMDVHSWYRVEWEAIAETIGFVQELDVALAAVRMVRDRVAATGAAAVQAFSSWLRAQRPTLEDGVSKPTDDVIRRLKGRPGTTVKVYIWRRGMDPALIERPTEDMVVEVTRGLITIPPVQVQMLPEHIGLIELTSFSGVASQELARWREPSTS